MREKQHHLTIIGQQRPFDEERWRELLTAFAYVLHEQRQAEAAPDAVNATDEPTAERGSPTHHAAHLPLAGAGEDG